MRLGIDIGTTKTAAVIYDCGKQELLAAKSVNNNAGTGRQDADKIIQATFASVPGKGTNVYIGFGETLISE